MEQYLNNIFKNLYGKDWKCANWKEKAEFFFLGVLLYCFVSHLFFPHD